MAIKKSESIFLWKSCDELRGGMDASQYKDYVLVLLFVKYVSIRIGNGDALWIETKEFKIKGKWRKKKLVMAAYYIQY